MTPRQPEKAIQGQIVALLRKVGCQVFVLGTHRRRGDYPGTMQTPGLPDLLAFLPRHGGLLAVEVKAPGGRLRPAQQAFRDACLACEAPYLIDHVVGGLDNVVRYLLKVELLKPDQVPHYRLPGKVA